MEAPSDEEDRLSAICKSQLQFQESDDKQELIKVSEKTAKFLLHIECAERLQAKGKEALPNTR